MQGVALHNAKLNEKFSTLLYSLLLTNTWVVFLSDDTETGQVDMNTSSDGFSKGEKQKRKRKAKV